MRRLSLAMICLALLVMTGCEAVVGGAVGAGATGGGYEVHLKRQKDRVEDDHKAGRIDQGEYEIRKDQIQ